MQKHEYPAGLTKNQKRHFRQHRQQAAITMHEAYAPKEATVPPWRSSGPQDDGGSSQRRSEGDDPAGPNQAARSAWQTKEERGRPESNREPGRAAAGEENRGSAVRVVVERGKQRMVIVHLEPQLKKRARLVARSEVETKDTLGGADGDCGENVVPELDKADSRESAAEMPEPWRPAPMVVEARGYDGRIAEFVRKGNFKVLPRRELERRVENIAWASAEDHLGLLLVQLLRWGSAGLDFPDGTASTIYLPKWEPDKWMSAELLQSALDTNLEDLLAAADRSTRTRGRRKGEPRVICKVLGSRTYFRAHLPE